MGPDKTSGPFQLSIGLRDVPCGVDVHLDLSSNIVGIVVSAIDHVIGHLALEGNGVVKLSLQYVPHLGRSCLGNGRGITAHRSLTGQQKVTRYDSVVSMSLVGLLMMLRRLLLVPMLLVSLIPVVPLVTLVVLVLVLLLLRMILLAWMLPFWPIDVL